MREKTLCKHLLSLVVLMPLLAPVEAGAEFYSYEDKNGTLHFVDDLEKVPKEYRKKKRVRKDKYDDLSEKERALMLENERRERDASRRREEERQARKRQARAEEDKKAAQERLRDALTTQVMISGNQVFVPVTLTNGSVETEAMLLLDTGATTSVITPEVAARLNIEQSDYVGVGVVGGKVLRAKRTVLSRMKVGPVSRNDQEIVIIRQRNNGFGDGLLGMSFLGGLKYTIDFKTQTINWFP